MRATDFSLMEIGEQTSVREIARQLVAGVRRWRRRVQGERKAGEGRPRVRGLVDLALTLDANWRYAHTTFLVGRLSSRLPRE
jgi:hypothetical protein